MNFDTENIFVFNLSVTQAIVNLSAALICGFLIAVLYRVTYKGVNYSSNYVVAIMMLSMITALVIMVIGNNLARAFGLVGAMSIIRFRTAVKDTQDIMFIFFSLATGLACGAGMFLIALTGTLFIGAATLIAVNINQENPKKKEYLLQLILLDELDNQNEIQGIMNRFCSKTKLINTKSLSEGSQNYLELSYYIQLKKVTQAQEFIMLIKKTEGVHKVNLFFDEE